MRGRRTQKSPGTFELLLTQHPKIRLPSYRTRCEPKNPPQDETTAALTVPTGSSHPLESGKERLTPHKG